MDLPVILVYLRAFPGCLNLILPGWASEPCRGVREFCSAQPVYDENTLRAALAPRLACCPWISMGSNTAYFFIPEVPTISCSVRTRRNVWSHRWNLPFQLLIYGCSTGIRSSVNSETNGNIGNNFCQSFPSCNHTISKTLILYRNTCVIPLQT